MNGILEKLNLRFLWYTWLSMTRTNWKWKSGPWSRAGSGGTDLVVYQQEVNGTIKVMWPAKPVVNKQVMYQNNLVTAKFKIIIHLIFIWFHFPLFYILMDGNNNCYHLLGIGYELCAEESVLHLLSHLIFINNYMRSVSLFPFLRCGNWTLVCW